MNLCVVPARGGSKRIPRKNIKEFYGKPMLAWSIEAAIASECFDRIIVSTDDDEIADVSRKIGAEVPFMRPAELAGDYLGTTEVIAHAVQWQNDHGAVTDNVCCIYPTAPFVQAKDINQGLDFLLRSKADFAFSVTSYAFPIQRAIRITQDERVEMFQAENFSARSQDLEKAWHDAGQFYWGKASAWLERKMIFRSNAVPIVLPRHMVQDIDTPEDWKRAELMFSALAREAN